MPDKPKLSKLARQHYALDRDMRAMWATGIHKFSQLCICRGRIRMIAHKDTGKIYTELWGSGVYMHLDWFADMIPPTIKNGHIATIIGNIQTFNLNSHVAMRNCLHVPKFGPVLGKEVRALIAKFVLTPNTYVPADQLDIIRDRVRARSKDRIAKAKAIKR